MKQILRYFIISTACASFAHADPGIITFEPNEKNPGFYSDAALESPADRDSWYESGSLDSRPWTWSIDMAGVAAISTIGVFGSPGGLNNLNVSPANSSADVQDKGPVDDGDKPSVGSPEASFSVLAAGFLILGVAQRKSPW